MRVLIAYDGSTPADAALSDLRLAGLPEQAEAVVFAAADIWCRSPSVAGSWVPPSLAERSSRADADAAVRRAEEDARRAAEQLAAILPRWTIRTRTNTETPATAILREAQQWPADLVVVGSQGRTGLARLVLGSVSHSVLTHAPCSVRIGRATSFVNPAPRILVGVDESEDARIAVEAVAARRWPPGSEVHVVHVLDFRLVWHSIDLPAHTGPHAEQGEESATIAPALVRLNAAGIQARGSVLEGDPADAIIEEARQRRCDCIFVGARGMGRLERLLLGSVSTHVASRAGCSVEVVRPPVG